MAPPLAPKRIPLPPDPPDTGNRVLKMKSTTSKTGTTNSAACSYQKSAETLRKVKAIEIALCGVHNSTEKEKDIRTDEVMLDTTDDPIEEPPNASTQNLIREEFPALPKRPADTNREDDPNTRTEKTPDPTIHSRETLMKDIKGLLDLTNEFLLDLEKRHPGVGSDFLALLADGASRAMRGQRVYTSTPTIPQPRDNKSSRTWAEKAASKVSEPMSYSFKKQVTRASPPQNQSKEDRRVMIRLDPNHEARKTEGLELRQTIQKLVPDSSLVSDVWIVPSGVAILAPTPAKAATILQAKKEIEERFGNATVERQETWTTFVIGPIQKKIRCLDGIRDPMDGLLQEELAHIRETVPIRDMGWTRRSQNDEPYGYVRVCVPESKAGKFPPRLRVFGEAVSIQRIRKRGQLVVCTKCHGFHAARTCARSLKCQKCGMDTHEGPCDRTPKCLNCLGSHFSNDLSCPARPRRMNGVFVRPTGVQLKQIRAAGRREFLKVKNQEAENSSPSPTSSGVVGTETTRTSNH